jgi:osmoprotectant transport system permease protein
VSAIAALGVLAQIEIRNRAGGDASCVQRNGFCPSWIADNIDNYFDPFVRHLELTVLAVLFGFIIAFGLALAAYRRRWLIGPITGVTGVLYTLPSLAVFFLLQPITGRGVTTALIALTAYTLLILFRNVMLGLDNVPAEIKDAGRGQGLSDGQLLWRVELPLALPEIVAGLRIAATTTVGLATLAFLAGAGGLGEPLFDGGEGINFKSNVVVAGGLCVVLAVALDLVLLGVQRLASPWQRARASS